MTLGLVALGSFAVLLWSWPRSSTVVVPVAAAGRSVFSRSELAASIAMVGIVIGLALKSPTIVVLGPVLVGATMFELRRRRARRAAVDRTAQTAACLDRITTQLRAGASLAGSFVGSLSDASMPVEHPLGEVVNRVRTGVPLVRALAETATGSSDGDVQLLATTVEVLADSGGSAVCALERVGDTLRERVVAEADARVQAQQAMTSAAVLGALPIVFAALGAASEPDLARFYLWHWLGTTCVVIACLLVVAGWLWMDRLVWGSA